MRITVWNINGLRTLKGYQPWYKLPDFEACLEHLGADIACFQETKMTRKQLTEPMCIMPKYHAFFNFHPTKGYSGTVTYVRKHTCIPVKAEEGITGRLVRDPYDSTTAIGCYPTDCQDDVDPAIFHDIDAEGRAVVLDCGLFVLFNLYCPNETGPERLEYKMSYYHCLAERARRLIDAGRQVMIVGDMNIIRDALDHCDPEQSIKDNELRDFKAHPARAWFNDFLYPRGKFHDVGRELHPDRTRMFTCWNTLIDARPANYGVRLDYTLVTEGLIPWVKGADIQPHIYGSDHCPIFIDLHDEREINGQTVRIRDLLNGGTDRAPPPLAAVFYDEFSGKQRKLASFFTKNSAPKTQTDVSLPEQDQPRTSQSQVQVIPGPVGSQDGPSLADALFALEQDSQDDPPPSTLASDTPSGTQTSSSSSLPVSRPPVPKTTSVSAPLRPSPKKAAKPVKGQTKLATFFNKPKDPAPATSSEPIPTPSVEAANGSVTETVPCSEAEAIADAEEVYSAAERVEASLAWGAIFSPIPAPRCRLHNEPARAWTVNKPGPNHNRKFWLCSRPVGPGYEKSGRSKADVNPEFRCNFFMWDSEVRAQAGKKRIDTPPTKAFAEVGRKRTSDSQDAPHKRVRQ